MSRLDLEQLQAERYAVRRYLSLVNGETTLLGIKRWRKNAIKWRKRYRRLEKYAEHLPQLRDVLEAKEDESTFEAAKRARAQIQVLNSLVKMLIKRVSHRRGCTIDKKVGECSCGLRGMIETARWMK